jgi:hypothetical protein
MYMITPASLSQQHGKYSQLYNCHKSPETGVGNWCKEVTYTYMACDFSVKHYVKKAHVQSTL